mgnify:CR=1 FL=1
MTMNSAHSVESYENRESRVPQPATGAPNVAEDLSLYFRRYAREKPEVVAMWCFGVGFIVGWKLKPW